MPLVYRACFPVTISKVDNLTDRKFTIVDIENYGQRYLDEVWESLTPEQRKQVPNYSETGISLDRADTLCTLMALFMQKYYEVCRTHKLGSVSNTYPAQALRRFRRYDYKDQIVTHDNEKAAKLESHCYHLGRAEARYTGRYTGKVYLVDYASLYPFLGCTKPFPVELLEHKENPRISTVKRWVREGIVLMHCQVTTNEPAYAYRTGSGVSYPVGSFPAFISAEECVQALEKGHCSIIYRASLYRGDYVLKITTSLYALISVCLRS